MNSNIERSGAAYYSLDNEMHSGRDVIPVEKRIMTAYPSKGGGLFPHEILVLAYANSFYTQDNRYQGFWWYRYGISDVDGILKKLFREGFIDVAPVIETLRKKTIPDLKNILELNGVNSKGKKEILIQRAIEEIPAEKLKKVLLKQLYRRTEKGEAELKNEEYVIYIHTYTVEDLDIWRLNKMVYESSVQRPYHDMIWDYLNRKSEEHFSTGNFGMGRNCRFAMSTLMNRMGKNEKELELLAEVVFYDLSGAGNNYDSQFLYITARWFFPYDTTLVHTAPGIIKRIFACKEKLHMSNEILRVALENGMCGLKTPIQLFRISECVDIVFYQYENDVESLRYIYQVAEKRFYKQHPELMI